jgi:aspartate racemase
MNRKFRIGIVGGMGPLAGVELHRLLVEAQDAQRDQDHLEVLLYTNPRIPDRTWSLQNNDGRTYVNAIGKSVQLLESAGVDMIVMACMTAHARFREIQEYTSVPMLDAVALSRRQLSELYNEKRVLLLATDGSIRSGVYTQNSYTTAWTIPDDRLQKEVMAVIYAIKAGGKNALLVQKLSQIIKSLDCQVTVLGCTELGLFFDDLVELGHDVVDPLRVVANEVVSLAKDPRSPVLFSKPPQVRDKTPILC